MSFIKEQQEEARGKLNKVYLRLALRGGDVYKAKQEVNEIISQVVQNAVDYALQKCTEDGKINECNYLKDLLTKLVNEHRDVGSGRQA